MKFLLSALCLVAALAVVFADNDSGHFIPKAFYTLDSDGHKSDVHPINRHTAHYLRRLRRETVSSSSSSSSVSSNGGPVFFTTQTVNSHAPDAVGFASRFGGESTAPVSHVVKTTGTGTGSSTSSSSSSSSVSSNGGPVYFTSETVNTHIPETVGFASRFGGESTAPVSHVVKTTGVINTDGKIYYDTKESHY